MKKNLIIILLLVLSCFSIFLSPFLSKGVIIMAPASAFSENNNYQEDFLIYNNRYYTRNTGISASEDLIGEYIGTVSNEQPFTEFSGNVQGDYYEVKGMSPKYILLCKNSQTCDVFISYYNERFLFGREYFEEVLNFKENADVFYYYKINPSEEGNACPMWYDYCQVKTEGENTAIKFLDAINSAKFIEIKDITKVPFKDSVCILNVMSEEGLNIPIQLFEGGYVSGALPLCYQRIDEALFNEFIEFLKAQETIKQP